jgi:hypothetical protein
MKKLFILLFFINVEFYSGELTLVFPLNDDDQWDIVINFSRTEIPKEVILITATLSRPRFKSFSASLDILRETITDIIFSSVPSGLWHLEVNAYDNLNIKKYSGELNVSVVGNRITQVNLSMIPTEENLGSIYISIIWGSLSENQWVDYQKNPVLSDLNGPFDDQGVAQAMIYYDSLKYMIWYIGLSKGKGYTLYAESKDGINWYRPIRSPVLTPGPIGSWDSYIVAPGPVIKENGIYKMYYAGYSNQDESRYIGLATSSDGICWEKHPTPVIVGSALWERQISPQSLIKKDGVYYLFYSGREKVYEGKIGLATSTDGIIWLKYSGNPVLTATENWEGLGVGWPSVIYENGIFQMVYQMISYRIKLFGMATSYDGKVWTKSASNPIFNSKNSQNGWANDGIAYPGFVKVGNEYRIYYSGWNNRKYKIGFIRKLQ